MAGFKLPEDLKFNRGLVVDATALARETGSASWLFLVGDEFAAMPGGIAYAEIETAVPQSARVVSDPPRVLNLDLARQHVAALDSLPRPTMITCRSGPRASAVAYMYAGLKLGASHDEVIEAAQLDNAPFCASEEYKAWVRESMTALRGENAGSSGDDE